MKPLAVSAALLCCTLTPACQSPVGQGGNGQALHELQASMTQACASLSDASARLLETMALKVNAAGSGGDALREAIKMKEALSLFSQRVGGLSKEAGGLPPPSGNGITDWLAEHGIGKRMADELERLKSALGEHCTTPLCAPPDWGGLSPAGLAYWLENYRLLAEQRKYELLTQLDAGLPPTSPTVIFDNMMAKAVPNARRLEVGDTLKVEIFMAAATSLADLKASVDGQNVWVNKLGIASYQKVLSEPGSFGLDMQLTPQSSASAYRAITRSTRLNYEVSEPCP